MNTCTCSMKGNKLPQFPLQNSVIGSENLVGFTPVSRWVHVRIVTLLPYSYHVKFFFFSDREESDQSLKNLYQKEALTYFSDTPNSLCFSLCYSTLPECSFSRRYELLVC